MGNDIRIVQFPEAGDEVTLVFRNKDIRDLRARIGDEFYTTIIDRFNRYDIECVYDVLKIGLKKDGKRFEVAEFEKLEETAFDKMNVHVLRTRTMDALQLALTGETYDEYMTRLMRDAMRNRDEALGGGKEESPLSSSPESSSENSETGHSKQGSLL